MEQHTFGYWLRLKRKSLDLTREGLADLVGCSAATIRKLEAEERRPSPQIAARLAGVLGIPPADQPGFLRFARGDWAAAPAPGAAAPPLPAARSVRSHLPAPASSLIGRSKDLEHVRAYCLREDRRLITLTGPPGIGKTRLSLEAARTLLPDYPDGVTFVALAPLDDPALVASTVVQTLGYPANPRRSAVELLLDGIGEQRMLLVLDNCEHVVEAAAQLAAELLAACPRLTILATSRAALRVPGEWLYAVPSLEVPPQPVTLDPAAAAEYGGLALFVERARAVRSDFTLRPDNLDAVSALCARVDGLPLGIELIAARVRLLSPQALLERLTDELVLSADGRRGVTARHKTLQQSIAWSFSLLSADEQRLLARLAVFSGGFTLEAAEAMPLGSASSRSAAELLAALLDKSLLQRNADVRGEPRYGLLVTIQHFALDHLRRLGWEAEARAWHAAYFLHWVEAAEGEIRGPRQAELLHAVEAEFDNFRGALDWSVSSGRIGEALRLLVALGWPWNLRHHHAEARTWFHRLRQRPEVAAYPALYAQLLNHVARTSWLAGDFREAQTLLEEALEIWRDVGPAGETGTALTLQWLGMVARWGRGDTATAESLFKQSFQRYQQAGHQRGMAETMMHLANVANDRRDLEHSRHLFQQSLDLFSDLGDRWGVGRLSQLMGDQALNQGDFARARSFFEQHLRIDQSLEFSEGIAVALRNLGNLHRCLGDFAQAEFYFNESLAVCRAHGMKDDMCKALYFLGLLALQRNDFSLAQTLIIDLYSLARRVYERTAEHNLFLGLAAVAGGARQPERSARLCGAARRSLAASGYRPAPFDQAEFDRHIQWARDQLGPDRFEALAAEGHALGPSEAIAYALER